MEASTQMNIHEYQQWVDRDAASKRVIELGLMYAGLGIAGEAGEVADEVKKRLRDDTLDPLSDEDRTKILEEVGDVLWYICRIANALDASVQEIQNINVSKITARHKEGYYKKG